MNIFKQELKSNFKSIITWSISIVLFVLFIMSMYQGFTSDVEGLKKLFEGFPKAIRDELGINLEIFFSILGFYSFIFLYVLLMGAIQAMNLGVSMLSKETRDKTADFLLTKPVTRVEIITGKLFASLVSILIINVVFFLISIISIEIFSSESYSFGVLVLLDLTLLFIQLIFMSFGFFLSVLIPKIKSVVSISLPTVFFFFVFSMLGSLVGEEAVRYLTPFEYFDREYIILNQQYEYRFMVLELIHIIGFIVGTYVIYHKKDIHAI